MTKRRGNREETKPRTRSNPRYTRKKRGSLNNGLQIINSQRGDVTSSQVRWTCSLVACRYPEGGKSRIEGSGERARDRWKERVHCLFKIQYIFSESYFRLQIIFGWTIAEEHFIYHLQDVRCKIYEECYIFPINKIFLKNHFLKGLYTLYFIKSSNTKKNKRYHVIRILNI